MLVFQIDQTAKNLSYLEILHLILQIKRKIKLNLKNWKVSYRLHYNFQNGNFIILKILFRTKTCGI